MHNEASNAISTANHRDTILWLVTSLHNRLMKSTCKKSRRRDLRLLEWLHVLSDETTTQSISIVSTTMTNDQLFLRYWWSVRTSKIITRAIQIPIFYAFMQPMANLRRKNLVEAAATSTDGQERDFAWSTRIVKATWCNGTATGTLGTTQQITQWRTLQLEPC